MVLPGDQDPAGPVLFMYLFRGIAPLAVESADQPGDEGVPLASGADEAAIWLESSTDETVTLPASGSDEATGKRIVEIAREQVGNRYAWAGSSPETGFDCSGFAWFVYQETGMNIPKQDLQGQLDAGPRIELEDLQPGDLVFFANTYKPGLSHVGVYVGDDEFVHAEWEETGVRVSKLQGSQWFAKYVGASRPR